MSDSKNLKTPDTIRLSVILPSQDLKARLESEARRRGWSTSQYAAWCIERMLEFKNLLAEVNR